MILKVKSKLIIKLLKNIKEDMKKTWKFIQNITKKFIML